VQIRAVADGSLVSTLTADVPLQHVSFSPDGKLAAAAGFELGDPPKCPVIMFDPATGTQKWKLVPDLGLQLSCLFSPDGTRVLLFHSAIVQVCDAHTGTQHWRLDMTAQQLLYRAGLSFDGATVALAIGNGAHAAGRRRN